MFLGKKIYHSRALGSVKWIVTSVSLILLSNLFFQTLNDAQFLDQGDKSFRAIWSYHLFYPQELIIFILSVFIPAIYYGYIRGVRFYEKGLIFNRGLPFFNMTVHYNNIKSYEVLNEKHLISITLADSKDDLMFSVGNLDRVVALFDQSGIQGDLGSSASSDYKAKKKLVLVVMIFGVLAALLQYSGLIRYLFR